MNGTFNYDYGRTLWMKMYLATPDFSRRVSDVKITFEQALGVIRTVDILTQGITKIVYLVGWQGLGHDDCYPEMHRVNDFLKRDCDRSGRESLLWLIGEAKRYHTVVSVHGNVSDAVEQTPVFHELVRANALVTACVSCTYSLWGSGCEVPVYHYLELLFNWNIPWNLAQGYLKLRFLFNDAKAGRDVRDYKGLDA